MAKAQGMQSYRCTSRGYTEDAAVMLLLNTVQQSSRCINVAKRYEKCTVLPDALAAAGRTSTVHAPAGVPERLS